MPSASPFLTTPKSSLAANKLSAQNVLTVGSQFVTAVLSALLLLEPNSITNLSSMSLMSSITEV